MIKKFKDIFNPKPNFFMPEGENGSASVEIAKPMNPAEQSALALEKKLQQARDEYAEKRRLGAIERLDFEKLKFAEVYVSLGKLDSAEEIVNSFSSRQLTDVDKELQKALMAATFEIIKKYKELGNLEMRNKWFERVNHLEEYAVLPPETNLIEDLASQANNPEHQN